MTIVQEHRYRSQNPKIRWRCWIRIHWSPHLELYGYEVLSSLNDKPGEVVKTSYDTTEGYELEDDALKWAEREAEDYVQQLAIDDPNQIHAWFGLTYANYLVLPRTIMQAMPGEWQNRFVELMDELKKTFDYTESNQDYEVRLRKQIDEFDGRPVYKYLDDPLSNYRHPPDLTPYRRKS